MSPAAPRQLAYLLLPMILASIGFAWAHAASEVMPFSAVYCVGFALAFYAARALPLKLPRGDRVQLILVVGLVGVAHRGIAELLVSVSLAGVMDVLLAVRGTEGDEIRRRSIDAIRSALVIGMVSPAHVLMRADAGFSPSGDSLLVIVVVVGMGYALLDLLTLSVQEWAAGGAGVADGVVMLARPLAPVYLVHIAMAAVVVRIYPSLGPWGFGIALLLTFILQNSFNLYLRIRRAYSETIRALAHAAELDRPDDVGHAQRVADAAVAVGRGLGMSSSELERVGYAALLHDIGRIGGERLEDDSDHPVRGAAIVGKVPFLEGVAPLIAGHRMVDAGDIPRGAAVIGVCCRYDRLSADCGADRALSMLRAEEDGVRLSAVAVLGSAPKRALRPTVTAESET